MYNNKNEFNKGDVFMRKLRILLVFSLLLLLAACGNDNELPALAEQAYNLGINGDADTNEGSPITTTLTVRGVNCQRCAATINTELFALDGVISVSLELAGGILVVEHEPTISVQEISDIILLEGFRIERVD